MKFKITIFMLAAFLGAAAFAAETDVVELKPTKFGLFPQEMMSMKDLRAKLLAGDPMLLLDARDKEAYDTGHIAGAVLPLPGEYYQQEKLFKSGVIATSPNHDAELAAAMKKYPQASLIVVYCNDNCSLSAVLLLQLKRMGFKNSFAMEDGFQSWAAAGYPAVPGKGVVQ